MASYRKYQTKKGQRWMVTVSYTDRYGKYRQVNKAGFKLKKEATQVALQLENELQQRDYFADSKLTFQQVYTKWLKIKADLKPSSLNNIHTVMRNHISPFFGEMIISKINFLFFNIFLLINVNNSVDEKSVICSEPKSSIINKSQLISKFSKSVSLLNFISFNALRRSSAVL